MEFKLRFKWSIYALLVGSMIMMFGGGVVAEHGFKDGKIIDTKSAVMGFSLAAFALLLMFFSIHSVSRDNARIDIDSFTEGAIKEGIEEKWKEIRNQILNSPK